MIKYFEPNINGTDYVVGDIHGCFSLLESTLLEIQFDRSKDRLFSVGDMIDRGAECHRVLEFLDKPWFHAVIGNHEEMIVNSGLSDNYMLHSLRNGGAWFYELDAELQANIVERFKRLPIVIQVGNIGVVHAEIPFSDWDDIPNVVNLCHPYELEQMLWGRTKIRSGNTDSIKNIDKVYVGHTVVTEWRILGNVYYIDTGAVYNGPNGRLTILKI